MEPTKLAVRTLLSGTFLFRGAEEAANMALLDRRCVEKQVSRGGMIYTRSSFQRCLGVVLEGQIEVSKQTLIMSVLGPGDLFGAAAVFNAREDYVTTLTARTPCRLLLLPQALVEELMDRFPIVAHNYVGYLSERIRFLSEKIDALTAGSAERKLAQYLLEHLEGECVAVECSATSLAKRLGVSRASLYRALDALSRAGIIQRTGRRISILDRNALEHTQERNE